MGERIRRESGLANAGMTNDLLPCAYCDIVPSKEHQYREVMTRKIRVQHECPKFTEVRHITDWYLENWNDLQRKRLDEKASNSD